MKGARLRSLLLLMVATGIVACATNPVTGIMISVQYLDASDQTHGFRRELGATLAGGQQAQVATVLGPFQNSNQFRVAIVGAKVAE